MPIFGPARKTRSNPKTSHNILPPLCIPVGLSSTFTATVVRSPSLKSPAPHNENTEHRASSKIRRLASTSDTKARVSQRLRNFRRKPASPGHTPRATTAATRVEALRRVLDPFFLRSSPSSSPSAAQRTFSARAARARASPWLSNHTPRTSPSVATTSALSSDLDESLRVYSIYRFVRAIRAGPNARDSGNDDVTFFSDDFVDFECNTEQGPKDKTRRLFHLSSFRRFRR